MTTSRPIIIVADRASFHLSRKVRDFVRSNRRRIRVFFLPRHAPDLNPSEQVWNEIKHRKLGREPIIDKKDLKRRVMLSLEALRKNTERLLSFFRLENTKYALNANAN